MSAPTMLKPFKARRYSIASLNVMPARLGRRYSGGQRRVENVQVERHVDGHVAAQATRQAGRRIDGREALEFLPRTGAYPYVEHLFYAQFFDAPHDRRVGESLALVVVPQVAMCVEVDYLHAREAARYGLHDRVCNEVLAAENQDLPARFVYLVYCLFYDVERMQQVSLAKLEVAVIAERHLFEVALEIRAVSLERP